MRLNKNSSFQKHVYTDLLAILMAHRRPVRTWRMLLPDCAWPLFKFSARARGSASPKKHAGGPDLRSDQIATAWRCRADTKFRLVEVHAFIIFKILHLYHPR